MFNVDLLDCDMDLLGFVCLLVNSVTGLTEVWLINTGETDDSIFPLPCMNLSPNCQNPELSSYGIFSLNLQENGLMFYSGC